MDSGPISAERDEPGVRWSAPDPVRRGNLKDKVVDHLRALILSGTMRSGAKIDQDALAEELRLSKLPVREALIELASEGLVDNIARRGAFVSALTPEDVRDHFLVYGRVAALAAERAAVTMNDEALAQLNHRLAEMGATDDPRELARLNHAFHRIINLAGGSRRLSSVLGLLARNVPFDFFQFAPGWADRAHEDHIRIAQAIGRRDPAVAGETMNDHLATAGTLVVTLLRDSGFWEPAGGRPRRARSMSDAEIAVGMWPPSTRSPRSMVPASDPSRGLPDDGGRIELAVVGAHLSGLALNHQLTERGGRLARAIRTTPAYRLYALDTEPPKPGMVRVATGGGAIEAEVWTLAPAAFGSFVADVPPPLTIGTVLLDDGTAVKGFLCEPVALDGAPDITGLGSWRAYLMSLDTNALDASR